MTIDVHGPGAPSLHPTLASETVFALASVSGHKWKGVKLVKGQPFPHFYGVHPIGWQDYPHRYQNIISMGTQDQIRRHPDEARADRSRNSSLDPDLRSKLPPLTHVGMEPMATAAAERLRSPGGMSPRGAPFGLADWGSP